MSAAKHTPGPWEACEPGAYSDFDGRSSVILGDDMRIAVVQGDSDSDIANARLIAAAPDLLEAAQAALTICERSNTGAAGEIAVLLAPAIAKATGSQV